MKPVGLVHAKAQEKSVLIGGDYCTDPLKINSYLEPKFHLRLDHSTWEYYLCDCIKEISGSLSYFCNVLSLGFVSVVTQFLHSQNHLFIYSLHYMLQSIYRN